MLTPGTLVTVTVSGEAKGLLTKDDLLSAVVQELGLLPLPTVRSAIDAGSVLYNAVTFQWFHYNYRAVVTVSTPSDTYDSADDVGDAVRGAFEDIAGTSPNAVQATIERSAPAIDAPPGGSMLPDLAGALESDVTKVVLIVAALIVLIVVTIGWSKNAGKLAGAVRM